MTTKKARSSRSDLLRKEYELSKLEHAQRGKHYLRALEGSNLVRIDPDVMKSFPNAEAVNDALRLLVEVAQAKVSKVGKARKKSLGT